MFIYYFEIHFFSDWLLLTSAIMTYFPLSFERQHNIFFFFVSLYYYSNIPCFCKFLKFATDVSL